MRARALGASLVLGLVATPLVTGLVDARPVADSNIAVLANSEYVDTGTIGDGGEVENVIDDLEAAGHTVTPFEDVSTEGLTTALDGAEVLVIPELENDDGGGDSATAAALSDDLGAEGKAVITDFVDGGGRIVFFGSSDPSYLINDLFGFAVEGTDFCYDEGGEPVAAAVGDPCMLTAAAADTEWADGPATINYVNDSTGLLPGSLPAGSTIAYDGQTGDGQLQAAGEDPPLVTDLAAVVSMPFGDGAVVFMGWDWYPDAEGELSAASAEEEADWAVVLDLGVSQPTVTASSQPGKLTFTSDSPSTQPVFVVAVVDGESITVTIPAKSTSGTADLPDGGSVEWSVPGWGVGEGTVEVLAATAAPVPVPAAPNFTG